MFLGLEFFPAVAAERADEGVAAVVTSWLHDEGVAAVNASRLLLNRVVLASSLIKRGFLGRDSTCGTVAVDMGAACVDAGVAVVVAFRLHNERSCCNGRRVSIASQPSSLG